MDENKALEIITAYYNKYSFLAAKSKEKHDELLKVYEAISVLKLKIETSNALEFQLRARIFDAEFENSSLQSKLEQMHVQIFGAKLNPPRNFEPNYEAAREKFNRDWITEISKRDNV